MNEPLFPVFDVPKTEYAKPERAEYKPSMLFDYAKGDFVQNGMRDIAEADGKTAYIQWCRKIVLTERSAFLAYAEDIGTEMEDAMRQGDYDAVESALERTITEALMVNPRTERVHDFRFTRIAGGLQCAFIVKGRDIGEETIRIAVMEE